MEFLNGTYSSLVALYTTSHPGRGFGLQFGMLGTLAAFFSVVVYVPRNRLKSLQFVGQKHHWLMLHMVSGLLCSFLVFVHATLVWSGIAGFANLAMWCSVVSGILVRYFSVRIPMKLFQSDCQLRSCNNQVRAALQEFEHLLEPEKLAQINADLNINVSHEARSSDNNMMSQFFKDVRVMLFLLKEIRRIKQHDVSTNNFVRLFLRHMFLRLDVLFLISQENCATLWSKVHVYLSLAFVLFFGIHGLIVFLFKPLYSF